MHGQTSKQTTTTPKCKVIEVNIVLVLVVFLQSKWNSEWFRKSVEHIRYLAPFKLQRHYPLSRLKQRYICTFIVVYVKKQRVIL